MGIIDKNGSVVENTTAADNIIYTMARVKPEFQDKQNMRWPVTNGDGETNGDGVNGFFACKKSH